MVKGNSPHKHYMSTVKYVNVINLCPNMSYEQEDFSS